MSIKEDVHPIILTSIPKRIGCYLKHDVRVVAYEYEATHIKYCL
jgi:hypothetical protein